MDLKLNIYKELSSISGYKLAVLCGIFKIAYKDNYGESLSHLASAILEADDTQLEICNAVMGIEIDQEENKLKRKRDEVKQMTTEEPVLDKSETTKKRKNKK